MRVKKREFFGFSRGCQGIGGLQEYREQQYLDVAEQVTEVVRTLRCSSTHRAGVETVKVGELGGCSLDGHLQRLARVTELVFDEQAIKVQDRDEPETQVRDLPTSIPRPPMGD